MRDNTFTAVRKFHRATGIMTDPSPTFRDLVSNFTDFLTVAIHTILYEREIYPQASFLSARKYNFSVRQNRHPKVCEWVNDAIAAIEAELLKCTVEKVAVVIFGKDAKALERFVFDVSQFPTVPSSDIDTPLERKAADGEKDAILPLVNIEEQFRATMNKITNCSSSLKQLPNGCTFTVAIELKGSGEAPIGHPQPWMPVQQTTKNAGLDSAARAIMPVRAVTAGDMIFETWIEESRERTIVD